jgi:hydrogenase/urease accessory protein HupE
MLKRLEERRIAQWAIAYLAGSWIALQVLELVWDVFELPLAPLRVLIGLIGLGFFVALAAAWERPRKAGVAAPRAAHSAGHGRVVPAPYTARPHHIIFWRPIA